MNLRLYFILPFVLQATVWRILMRTFFNLFSRFAVNGLENLKGLKGPIIFAPNHSNELDSVLIPLALPVWSRFSPIFYVVREPKFYDDPFFGWRRYLYAGWLFKLLGAFPVVSGLKNYEKSLKNHVNILKDGGSVCIFPEGGFTKTGEIGEGHGGVAFMAYASGAPVVPVLIEGTFKLTVSKLLSRKCAISITFLKPMHASDSIRLNPEIEDYVGFSTVVLASIKNAKVTGHSTLHVNN